MAWTRFFAGALLAAAALLTGCATSTSSPPADSPPSAEPTRPAAPPAASVPPSAPSDMPESATADPAKPDAGSFTEIGRGQASWYGPGFHGRKTANGERYDQRAMTAAHKTLPFGSLVRVRSLVNGKEVDVRINDRGPFIGGRVIDVSRAAAEALGMMGVGVKPVLLLVSSTTSRQRGPEAPTAGMPLR